MSVVMSSSHVRRFVVSPRNCPSSAAPGPGGTTARPHAAAQPQSHGIALDQFQQSVQGGVERISSGAAAGAERPWRIEIADLRRDGENTDPPADGTAFHPHRLAASVQSERSASGFRRQRQQPFPQGPQGRRRVRAVLRRRSAAQLVVRGGELGDDIRRLRRRRIRTPGGNSGRCRRHCRSAHPRTPMQPASTSAPSTTRPGASSAGMEKMRWNRAPPAATPSGVVAASCAPSRYWSLSSKSSGGPWPAASPARNFAAVPSNSTSGWVSHAITVGPWFARRGCWDFTLASRAFSVNRTHDVQATELSANTWPEPGVCRRNAREADRPRHRRRTAVRVDDRVPLGHATARTCRSAGRRCRPIPAMRRLV